MDSVPPTAIFAGARPSRSAPVHGSSVEISVVDNGATTAGPVPGLLSLPEARRGLGAALAPRGSTFTSTVDNEAMHDGPVPGLLSLSWTVAGLPANRALHAVVWGLLPTGVV